MLKCYLTRLVVYDIHRKIGTCYNEIGVCAQSIKTTPGSMMNPIENVYAIANVCSLVPFSSSPT
jgi:hypothetical protein